MWARNVKASPVAPRPATQSDIKKSSNLWTWLTHTTNHTSVRLACTIPAQGAGPCCRVTDSRETVAPVSRYRGWDREGGVTGRCSMRSAVVSFLTYLPMTMKGLVQKEANSKPPLPRSLPAAAAPPPRAATHRRAATSWNKVEFSQLKIQASKI